LYIFGEKYRRLQNYYAIILVIAGLPLPNIRKEELFKMKKTLLLSMALTFAFSTGCQATGASLTTGEAKAAGRAEFNDIASHWAKNTILKAVQQGYVDGYEDMTFKPEINVSRAEFLKMAVTALKLPVTGDTTGSQWFKPYEDAAKEKGILRDSDFPEDTINNSISRLEMARISVRASDSTFQNKAVQIDDNSVMFNATKTGLIQGLAKGELGPDQSTTRAQSVTIIERILMVNSGNKLEVDKYAVSNAELALKHTNIFSVMPQIFGGKQIEAWDIAKLTMETGDGLYKATMDQIVAIDLEDPNDPNLGLLGDLNKLKWFNTRSFENSPLVKDGFMKSYALYFKGHVDFNKDKEIYGDNKQPVFGLNGFLRGEPTDPMNNILSGNAALFNKVNGDIPGIIIPKNCAIGDTVGIDLYAPARPPYEDYNKRIFYSEVPKK
jgi:hypothetical protein